MAILQLAEQVINAVAAKLAAGVNARIDAINTEFGDDVTLDHPQIAKYGVSLMPPGPLLIVTDGGTPEGGQFKEEGPHSLEYVLQIVVLCKDDDASRVSLGRRLLRLERAVIECLWDDDPREQLTITNGASTTQPPITPNRVIPGPIFQPTGDESLLSSYRIAVFHVTKREN